MTDAVRLAPTEEQRAECAAAEKRFDEALAAASVGCWANEDCDLFESCRAVTAASTARLWKLKDQAKDACRPVRDTYETLSCASRVKCVEGRCVRS